MIFGGNIGGNVNISIYNSGRLKSSPAHLLIYICNVDESSSKVSQLQENTRSYIKSLIKALQGTPSSQKCLFYYFGGKSVANFFIHFLYICIP